MEQRPFGTSGLRVSELGFCLTESRLLKPAFTGGVNFFMTPEASIRDVVLRETGGKALVAAGPCDGRYELHAQGRTLVGLSVKEPRDLALASWIAAPFNPMEQGLTREVLAPASRRGCAVVATHVLAGGALAGPLGHTPYGARVASLRSLVTPRRTLVQAAIQFVLASEYVTCAVVRVSSEAHLEEALGALKVAPLTGSDLEMIFETYANRYDP